MAWIASATNLLTSLGAAGAFPSLCHEVMLLFRLEFQPPPAALKLTEAPFDTVRIFGVTFS